MSRKKLKPEETRQPAPMRMIPAYWRKLKAVAKAFGISPGEWTEQQVEPHMRPEDRAK